MSARRASPLPSPRTLHRTSLVLAAALAGACAGNDAARTRTAADVTLPARLDDAAVPQALRVFHSLPPGDPTRAEVRERLVAYHAARTPDVLATEDYAAIVEHLERFAGLYSPTEVGEGRVSPAVRPVAAAVVALGTPRNDEANVLSALRLALATGEPPDREALQASYDAIVAWGRDARGTLDSSIATTARLAELWERHAAVAPAPEVLDYLAGLYAELRARLLELVRGGLGREGPPPGLSFRDLRMAPAQLRRATANVAAVYLQHGDVAQAAARVEAIGDLAGPELELLRTLGDARRGGEAGADALFALASFYGDVEGGEPRPEVVRGLCRAGLQQQPDDPRFPLCLARVATAANDHLDATAWYAEAIRLAPEQRRLYDEALESLAGLVGEGLFDADPSIARGIAAEAEHILRERMARFPDSEPAVRPSALHLAMGLLEMNAGNAEAARRQLEASLADRETPAALLQLGLLEERTGRPREAARHYRRALDLTPETDLELRFQRAELLEHLGDAFREAGDAAQARRMYAQALDLYDAMPVAELSGRGRAQLELRRGVLRDRLGDPTAARAAFDAALDAAPDSQEVYARVLAHLVVGGDPSLGFAESVFLRAQRQLTLEPEWKVYFALWVGAIAARLGATPSDDVRVVLAELASSPDWFGRLAKFGVGELPYPELLDEASGLGERTEAHFYEGARLLGVGDRAGATRLFQLVLDTNMVNFFEFAMAQELLDPTDGAAVGAGAAPPGL